MTCHEAIVSMETVGEAVWHLKNRKKFRRLTKPSSAAQGSCSDRNFFACFSWKWHFYFANIAIKHEFACFHQYHLWIWSTILDHDPGVLLWTSQTQRHIFCFLHKFWIIRANYSFPAWSKIIEQPCLVPGHAFSLPILPDVLLPAFRTRPMSGLRMAPRSSISPSWHYTCLHNPEFFITVSFKNGYGEANLVIVIKLALCDLPMFGKDGWQYFFQGCFPAVPVTPTTIAPVLFLQHVASFPKALTVSSATKDWNGISEAMVFGKMADAPFFQCFVTKSWCHPLSGLLYIKRPFFWNFCYRWPLNILCPLSQASPATSVFQTGCNFVHCHAQFQNSRTISDRCNGVLLLNYLILLMAFSGYHQQRIILRPAVQGPSSLSPAFCLLH